MILEFHSKGDFREFLLFGLFDEVRHQERIHLGRCSLGFYVKSVLGQERQVARDRGDKVNQTSSGLSQGTLLHPELDQWRLVQRQP